MIMDIDRIISDIAEKKRALLERITLRDANIWLGEPEHFPLSNELTMESLRSRMHRYNIGGALISHWNATRYSAQDGNSSLIDISDDLPENVFTVWTGLPLQPREPGSLPCVCPPHPKMRAIRLYPKTHSFHFVSWVVGSLCKWCIEHDLPIFIWHLEVDWNNLFSISSMFPELRIVLETQWQKIIYHNRNLFSLLDACPNVCVESSNFAGQDHVRYLVEQFGAERLIFGSFLPVNDPLASIGMILDADVALRDKELMLGGNLKRITGIM